VDMLGHDDVGPNKKAVPFPRKSKAIEKDTLGIVVRKEWLAPIACEGQLVDMPVDVGRLAFGTSLLDHELNDSIVMFSSPLNPDKRHEPSACPGHPVVYDETHPPFRVMM
jgi:hypothetical protein